MKQECLEQRRALTLIEILAVVCIIALAASLTLGGLGSASADAQLRGLFAECRQLDSRGRLLARAEGPMSIAVGQEHDSLIAGHDGQAPLLRVQGMNGWTIHLRNNSGEEAEPIQIDARGRSEDYMIELRPSEVIESAQPSRTLRVAGLTGWIEETTLP